MYEYCGYDVVNKNKSQTITADTVISFGVGGIFGVDRNNIRKNDKQLYVCLK